MRALHPTPLLRKPVITRKPLHGLIRLLSRIRRVKKTTQTKKTHCHGIGKNHQPLYHCHCCLFGHFAPLPYLCQGLSHGSRTKPHLYYASLVNGIQARTASLLDYQLDELVCAQPDDPFALKRPRSKLQHNRTGVHEFQRLVRRSRSQILPHR